MDVNKLLDELEDFMDRRGRLFRRAFLLDVDDVLDYTSQIRASLPQQIQRADQITREKDRILGEAEETAGRLVADADARAESAIRTAQDEARILVSSHEITRQAQAEAQRLIEQATKEAELVRQGAMDYARNILDNLDQAVENVVRHTTQLQEVVKSARGELKS